MKNLLLLFLFVLSFSSTSLAGNYKLNNASVDELFEQAEEIDLTTFLNGPIDYSNLNNSATPLNISGTKGKSLVGFLLIGFFLGYLGIHRLYMGTNFGSFIWAVYCIPTYGYVLAIIDLVYVLIEEERLEDYRKNNDLFVWRGKF